MNDPPPNFTPVPVFMQQPPQPMMRAEAVVPARVRVAMEYLNLMSQKTMTHAAGNDLIIEQIPGQELTDEEASAQATACNMLENYFAGKMPPDYWERLDAQDRAHDRGEEGTIMPCPNCGEGVAVGSAKECRLCCGNRFIFVTPAVMDEMEVN